jgi:hypothetical protein
VTKSEKMAKVAQELTSHGTKVTAGVMMPVLEGAYPGEEWKKNGVANWLSTTWRKSNKVDEPAIPAVAQKEGDVSPPLVQAIKLARQLNQLVGPEVAEVLVKELK